MKAIRTVLCAAAVLLATGVTAREASLLRLMPSTLVGTHERGEYVGRDAKTGEELWRTRWTVERPSEDAAQVRVREDGAGRRGRAEPTRWTVSMDVDLRDGRESFSSTRELWDATGRPLESQRRTMTYGNGSGVVTTVDHAKQTEQSVTFAVDNESIPTELLATELRALPGLSGRRMPFRLVTRDGKVVPMVARIVGEEIVTTPAGTFPCYKTELSISGVRGAVGQFLLPPMHMWHRVEAPHAWVKYQGPDGGLGSREVTMELVSFDSGGRAERNTR